MFRLIVFLIVAVALALVAAWFADNPGQVALTWLGVHVETSVAILLIGVLLVGVVLTLLFELLRLLRAAPRRIAEWRRQSRTRRGWQALSQGMVAAAAGDALAARHLTRRAEKLLNDSPSTLLLSAQSAQLEGDETAARLKFQEMLKHRETEFLGLRGLLAQAMKDGDTETALRLARRAYLRRPNTPWVLQTLFELQTRTGLWRDALSTVGDMARYKFIDRQTATRRRAILFHEAAGQERTNGNLQEALKLASKAHKLLPALAPIAVQASEIAEQAAKPRLARKFLEASWKARPHPAIARSYLALEQEQTPAERFRVLERLCQSAPGHLESELVLAEAAIAAKQWPAARAALERALKREPTASVYRLLAELEQVDGGHSERARAWLAKAVDAPPDPAWVCETTGEMRASWSPFGPDGRFDSLRWGSPPKIVPLLEEGAPAELILPGTARATSTSAAASAAAPVGAGAAGAGAPASAGPTLQPVQAPVTAPAQSA